MTSEFFGKLSQDFTNLLESEYGYDVTFEVGEQSNTCLFKAHSVILYQRSPYFRQKLANANKKNNIIEIKLPHISAEMFNAIIKYIYSGIISLKNYEASAIFDLLITINEFMFPELISHFQHILIKNSTSWLRLNFSRVYQISFQNENFIDLQNFCNDVIIQQPRMIFDSDDFTNLQENALIALLKNDDLKMDESEIWDKVILWGKVKTPNLPSKIEEWNNDNFKSLKSTLQNCLPHIRYFQVSGEDVLKKIKPYRNILEDYIWDDIISKLIAPNISITSSILPPRKKAMVQISPRKVSIIKPSSSIITLQHAAEISSWIDQRSAIYDIAEIPYQFSLLLKGTRDGFTGEAFHRLCDNIPGTIVAVKVNGTNEILGGYNPSIWKADNWMFGETTGSFIFSLKNENLNQSILSRVTDKLRAIYYSDVSCGPWFGVSSFGSNYDTKSWFHSSKFGYHSIRSVDGWFSIDEYEVFQIRKI